jgi:hypothetical protein
MKSSTRALGGATLALAAGRWPLAAGIMPANAQDLQTTSAGSMPLVPVFVIVHVPKPWYVPKAVVVGKMRDTIPDYAKRSGLMFKAFSFERNSGDFGGLYFWRDKASAEAWFNPAWFERVRKERSADAQVRMLDATVSVDNTGGGTQSHTWAAFAGRRRSPPGCSRSLAIVC